MVFLDLFLKIDLVFFYLMFSDSKTLLLVEYAPMMADMQGEEVQTG